MAEADFDYLEVWRGWPEVYSADSSNSGTRVVGIVMKHFLADSLAKFATDFVEISHCYYSVVRRQSRQKAVRKDVQFSQLGFL